MPTRAEEFFAGARIRIKEYCGKPSKYDGLAGTVRAIYGDKFYRVDLDNDPDDDTGLGILCYANELEKNDD